MGRVLRRNALRECGVGRWGLLNYAYDVEVFTDVWPKVKARAVGTTRNRCMMAVFVRTTQLIERMRRALNGIQSEQIQQVHICCNCQCHALAALPAVWFVVALGYFACGLAERVEISVCAMLFKAANANTAHSQVKNSARNGTECVNVVLSVCVCVCSSVARCVSFNQPSGYQQSAGRANPDNSPSIPVHLNHSVRFYVGRVSVCLNTRAQKTTTNVIACGAGAPSRCLGKCK